VDINAEVFVWLWAILRLQPRRPITNAFERFGVNRARKTIMTTAAQRPEDGRGDLWTGFLLQHDPPDQNPASAPDQSEGARFRITFAQYFR
jgi:hypothetical protein